MAPSRWLSDRYSSELAATGEVIYLTRDDRRLAAIVAAEAAAAEAGEDIPARVTALQLSGVAT